MDQVVKRFALSHESPRFLDMKLDPRILVNLTRERRVPILHECRHLRIQLHGIDTSGAMVKRK